MDKPYRPYHSPLPESPGVASISPCGRKVRRSRPVSTWMRRHPLKFWGGVWLSVIGVVGIATLGLLNPDLSATRQRTDGAIASSTATESAPPSENRVPFWLFGAIALTCGAGSLLISQQLTPPSAAGRRRTGKPRRRKRPAAHPGRPISTDLSPSPMPAHAAGFQPPSNSFTKPVPSSRHPRPVAPPVVVTVVPPEQLHPLDWQDASLAHLLDLRQQRSLASWMDRPAEPPYPR